MSDTQTSPNVPDLKSRSNLFSGTGNLWLESVVTLNFFFAILLRLAFLIILATLGLDTFVLLMKFLGDPGASVYFLLFSNT
ncbi:MAG TPA: hypothetical protein DEO71_02985 [Chryseobacterium sp.]|nr:hypothetical protein [Chryseobacterium sp.]